MSEKQTTERLVEAAAERLSSWILIPEEFRDALKITLKGRLEEVIEPILAEVRAEVLADVSAALFRVGESAANSDEEDEWIKGVLDATDDVAKEFGIPVQTKPILKENPNPPTV